MTEEEFVISDQEAEVVAKLAEARSAKNEWTKVEKALREQVVGILGGRQRALTAAGVPVVTVTVTTRRVVNSSKLEALYPDIYAEVSEETTIERIGIK